MSSQTDAPDDLTLSRREILLGAAVATLTPFPAPAVAAPAEGKRIASTAERMSRDDYLSALDTIMRVHDSLNALVADAMQRVGRYDLGEADAMLIVQMDRAERAGLPCPARRAGLHREVCARLAEGRFIRLAGRGLSKHLVLTAKGRKVAAILSDAFEAQARTLRWFTPFGSQRVTEMNEALAGFADGWRDIVLYRMYGLLYCWQYSNTAC